MADESRPRRYSDDEVRHLLERASELEAEGGSPAVRADGPTLKELESIAAEAGLDPELLRRAAWELDTAPPASPERSRLDAVVGAPLSGRVERVVQGEVPPEALEEMLVAIQRRTGDTGNPYLLGRSLTWRSSASSPMDASMPRPILNVSVTARDGRTRITSQGDYRAVAGSIFGGTVGGVGCGVGFGVGFGVGLGALGSVAFASLFPPAMLGLTWIAARTMYGGVVRNRSREMEELADELMRIAEARAS